VDLRPDQALRRDQRGLPKLTAAIVLTTAGSADEADRLAEALVVERLAACVQTTPIVSRYVWKGELQKDAEVLLLIKTRAELFEAVRARIRALHSYETPEVLMADVAAGDADYLAWLEAGTDPA
jgi:periplasmic divalent cation tolerance protein